MSTWFDGTNEISTSLQRIEESLKDLGKHYVGVVSLMPGLSSVELLEAGDDFVTIKTNEGLMTRAGISRQIEADRVVVEFDEVYTAGSVTAKSHYMDEFTATDGGVNHRTVISGVLAPGFLGFFYRTFGSSSTGNAVLNAYKGYFEE